MRRCKSEQIKDVVNMFLRQEGLETPLMQHRLVNSWADVMGEGIRRYTGYIFIRNQTLHVQIHSAVLRNELMLTRSSLVHKLNDAVGAQIISDIQFHN